MSLAGNIKLHRKKAQKTQLQLAQELKISLATLRRWEAGKTTPTAKMVKELAECLKTSPENFFTDEKKEKNLMREKSSGMLVLEIAGKRVEIPPTERGYEIFNNLLGKIF